MQDYTWENIGESLKKECEGTPFTKFYKDLPEILKKRPDGPITIYLSAIEQPQEFGTGDIQRILMLVKVNRTKRLLIDAFPHLRSYLKDEKFYTEKL